VSGLVLRLGLIVRIDTGALLNGIRELEAKPSDHHSQVRVRDKG
jgi:hypothetical protein